MPSFCTVWCRHHCCCWSFGSHLSRSGHLDSGGSGHWDAFRTALSVNFHGLGVVGADRTLDFDAHYVVGVVARASPARPVAPCLVHSNKSVVSEIAVIFDGPASAADSIFRIVIDHLVSFLALDEAMFRAVLHPVLTLAQVALAFLPCFRWKFSTNIFNRCRLFNNA